MRSNISQSNKRAFRNPWVIGWIALVAIVLGVNAAMITLAVVTNPGLVSEDYYEQGRDFERNLHQRVAARNALGWEMRLDIPETLRSARRETLRFTAVDKHGLPLEKLKVKLIGYRPSDASADFSTDLDAFGGGIYQASVNFPLKGMWELTLQAEHEGQHYNLIHKRLMVQG